MTRQEVIISKNLEQSLAAAIEKCPHDRLFVLTDTTTLELCWPVTQNYEPCRRAEPHATA